VLKLTTALACFCLLLVSDFALLSAPMHGVGSNGMPTPVQHGDDACFLSSIVTVCTS
jgi:hypothetical protein